jgi:HEAT repeat protein
MMQIFAGEPPIGVLASITDSLAKAIQNRNPHVRIFAAMGLAMLRLESLRTTPLLIGLLKDEQPSVRILAATGLARLGDLAIEAIPLLEAALEDPDPQVGRSVRSAIDRIKGPGDSQLQPQT